MIQEHWGFSRPGVFWPRREIHAIKAHQLVGGGNPQKACLIECQAGNDGFWQSAKMIPMPKRIVLEQAAFWKCLGNPRGEAREEDE